MEEDPATELEYLAAQASTARDQYRSAVRARNRFMRSLDGTVTQNVIARWASMSEPQVLRILAVEGDDDDG